MTNMKFKASLLFFITVLSTQCSFNHYKYTSGDTRNAEGKCYAPCQIPSIYDTQTKRYAVFTGDEIEEIAGIDTLEIVTEPASMKWIKKKADRNCLSADPNDCLVWCLVEIPAKTAVIKVLTDTTQSPNFEMRKILTNEIVRTGGGTELRQVICDSDITQEIIAQIQDILRDNGFYKGENSDELNKDTKIALTNFQKFYSLPEGQLDFKTLEALGIVLE